MYRFHYYCIVCYIIRAFVAIQILAATPINVYSIAGAKVTHHESKTCHPNFSLPFSPRTFFKPMF